MLILLRDLGPCPRCHGQLEAGPDGPTCLHCGRSPVGDAPLHSEPETQVKMPRLDGEGCEMAPSCFECPLLLCKYEMVAA